MSPAVSRRPRESRAERMAKLLTRHGLDKPLAPPRVVPWEETAYLAIRPETMRAMDRWADGVMVSTADTARTRRRAYAARVWLARRLARMAVHEGFAAVWRGHAREDLYRWRIWREAERRTRRGR